MSAYYRLITVTKGKERHAMRKFHTFIITKRNIQLAAFAVGILTCIGTGIAVFKSPAAVPVFSSFDKNDELYTEILDEGLPGNDDKLHLTDLVSKIFGFNPDEPESIIKEASSAFDSPPEATSSPVYETAQATASPTQTVNDDPNSQTSGSLPSHEQIINSVGLKINNATNYDVDINALCSEPLPVSLKLNEPEVLIMHTHTTECYDGDAMPGESERTTDSNYNVCAIGDIISNILNEYGIKTIHDTTIHDYPSYQGSYTRALETINKNINEHPSIRVVLDIHRDAYIYNDGTKLKVSTELNGESVAQVMLVLGTDSMNLYHPYWRDNLTLASKVQNAAEIIAPGIMRPLNLRRERFNMHATRGSILIEFGSNGNTLDEVKRSAAYIGKSLAAALLNG